MSVIDPQPLKPVLLLICCQGVVVAAIVTDNAILVKPRFSNPPGELPSSPVVKGPPRSDKVKCICYSRTLLTPAGAVDLMPKVVLIAVAAALKFSAVMLATGRMS